MLMLLLLLMRGGLARRRQWASDGRCGMGRERGEGSESRRCAFPSSTATENLRHAEGFGA